VDCRDLNLPSDDWRVIGASVIGSSHEVSQTRCQDAWSLAYSLGPGGDTAIVAVADGAGSATYSHLGARTATRCAVHLVGEHLAGGGVLGKADLAAILGAVRDAVGEEARERERPAGEFASTLLVLVAAPWGTLAAHIGDGAIIVDDGTLRVLTWPEQGEYANVTVFLTTASAVENARIVEAGPISRFALLSDGLQNLALDYAAHTVFAPFFEPMLRPLGNPEADRVKLEAALDTFLGSPTINRRTDDDKSLVLGVRTAPSPALKVAQTLAQKTP
jgi:alpha-D-ribose 1-methylphosphonate 5-triphosphate synthase subunit PhnG